jgi:hypothetical protein
MGFLDNSGDIILDAVLTDAGRKRLARGDGTFKITKYAFGDDEINYGQYNSTAASGTAYYDLEILQTPILEAFTNNRSSLKSKLISLTNNNLLYLPQIVLNQVDSVTKLPTEQFFGSGSFLVAINEDTINKLNENTNYPYINGTNTTPNVSGMQYIRTDQGMTTTKLSADVRLSPELTEQQYMIEIDNRLGQIVDIGPFATNGTGLASPAFIDDDQIATYYVTQNVGGFIADCSPGPLSATQGGPGTAAVGAGTTAAETLSGPRGTKLGFTIYAKDNLRQSDHLFDTIGESKNNPTGLAGYLFKIISTTVRITGVTTGYRIEIPVTFVKRTSS